MHVNAILEILHVVAAVVFVTPTVVFPFVGVAALRAGDGPGAGRAARSTVLWSLVSLSVAGFGSLAALGADPERLTLTTPWLLASLVAFLTSVVIAVGVVAPALRTGSTRAERRAPRVVAVTGGVLVTALILTVTVLMLWRPTG